jgi:hypothetical protein
MNLLQVNLLKKNERRYQGIVSMKVMALVSVSVLAGTTILVFLLAGISRMTLNSDLAKAKDEWGRLEPRAALVRNSQAAVEANLKTLAGLESWAQSEHLTMHRILRAVQSRIPEQMALEHLFAGLEQTADSDPIFCALRLSGRAHGELTAVEARRRLNTDGQVVGFCGEVRLVSSQRESGDVWIFALEARRAAGGTP